MHAAKGLQTSLQLQRLTFEKGIARLTIDDPMKAFIFMVVPIGVLRLYGQFTARICFVEVGECCICNAGRGKARADRFQFCHHLEHFDQFNRARLADEHPSMGYLLYQSSLGKPLKRLTYRRSGYSKPFRELFFIQALPVTERAIKNEAFQGVCDAV